ncbi:MAG TPA: histidinol-phosphatase [Mycobacteriales bacterium]|nr:histidinol-phosphatase [Mycobacteriales bacterium]
MAGYADDLSLAHLLADTADAISMARFRALDLHVESKPDLTPVSDADTAVEKALRATLARTRPRDAVLGEEFGASQAAAGPGTRQWVIDPIDGTKNFVRGVPVWATLIALQEDEHTVLGLVSAPALGRRWYATRGGGAWTRPAYSDDHPGTPCHVSKVGSVSDAFLSYASLDGWAASGRDEAFARLMTQVWRTRAFGDFWSYMLVAEGAVDVACEPEVSLWDLAALNVIVEEAGGRFTDLDGVDRVDGGSAIATNGLLHDQVLDTLNRP